MRYLEWEVEVEDDVMKLLEQVKDHPMIMKHGYYKLA